VPFVSLGRPTDLQNISYVATDNAAAAYLHSRSNAMSSFGRAKIKTNPVTASRDQGDGQRTVRQNRGYLPQFQYFEVRMIQSSIGVEGARL
jgi:hypothetical protein